MYKAFNILFGGLVVVVFLAMGAMAVHAHEVNGVKHAEPKTELPKGVKLFGGPFSLTDHNGKARTDADFQGKYMLVNFGYTSCPDICPTALSTITGALDELGAPADKVQPLFISVDPDRDTQNVLAEYAKHFHPQFLMLRGNEAQTRAVSKAYRIHRTKVVVEDAEDDDYLVNHSSLTYLMDKQGKFLTIFPHGTPAEKMAVTMAKYVR